jgi:D-alanine-D-alanine ligase
MTNHCHTSKTILLIFGGGGNEHAVSQTSQRYIAETLRKNPAYQVSVVEIKKNRDWVFLNHDGRETICFLQQQSLIIPELKQTKKIDYCIPCIHGHPGETGHIQGLLTLMGLPYLGCDLTTSSNCMNKITTKLWLQLFGVPVVPFDVLTDMSTKGQQKAKDFFLRYKDIFIKSSSEGSSVGVYHVTKIEDLEIKIEEAFKYSQYVLLEQRIFGREIEVSTFEYKNKLHSTHPGEIICPSGFYSYEEKYDSQSKTRTEVKAQNIQNSEVQQIRQMAEQTYQILKIKDLSRIDFFLCPNSGSGSSIYVNEVNTFPGMTPISLFPKMMAESGISFFDFLCDRIDNGVR